MSKRVLFKIGIGDFEHGFMVSLRIQTPDHPEIEIEGELPPAPDLPALYAAWQGSYGYQGLGSYRALEAVEEEVTHISVQDAAQALESRLNGWFNTSYPQFRPIREGLLYYLQERDRIRFMFRAKDKLLETFPWHLCDLFQQYPQADIALSIGQKPLEPVIRPHQSKIRILTILGDTTDINVQADLQVLQERLPKDAEILDPLIVTGREKIDEALWKQSADILFFAGHSTSRQKGQFFINETESLTISDLKYALRRAITRGLKLVIFNSCDGLQLARDLANLQMPAMIVMRDRIPDEAAQRFLEYFLEAYAQDQKPLDLAVREARERLHGLENRYPCVSWLPILCQHPTAEALTWPQLRQSEEVVPEVPPKPVSRRFSLWQRVKVGVLASLLVTGGVVGMRSFGWLEAWELKAYDHFMQQRLQVNNEGMDNRITLIEITSKDVQSQPAQERNSASISERSLTQLLTILKQHKPRVIALQVYREARATSEELHQLLTNSNLLIGLCAYRSSDDAGVPYPPEINISSRLGFGNVLEDFDGILRGQIVANTDPLEPCPTSNSFEFQVAKHYLALEDKPTQLKRNLQNITPNSKNRSSPLIEKNSGGYWNRNAAGYQILLNYRATEQIAPQFTLTEALNNQISPDLIKDRIIIIGTTDPSFKDNKWLTPYSHGYRSIRTMTGIEITAHGVSQIISAALDQRPLIRFWLEPIEILWILSWSLIGSILTTIFRRLNHLIFATAIGLGLLYGVCLTFLIQGTWIPFIFPAFSLIMTVIVIIVWQKNNFYKA